MIIYHLHPFTMFHFCHCASHQKMEKLEPFADRHLRLLLLLRWAKVRLDAAVYLCIAIYILWYTLGIVGIYGLCLCCNVALHKSISIFSWLEDVQGKLLITNVYNHVHMHVDLQRPWPWCSSDVILFMIFTRASKPQHFSPTDLPAAIDLIFKMCDLCYVDFPEIDAGFFLVA